jgi:hypothetical protein
VAAYTFSYLCGFAGAGTLRAWPYPYDAYDLMDLAAAHGLGACSAEAAYLVRHARASRRYDDVLGAPRSA